VSYKKNNNEPKCRGLTVEVKNDDINRALRTFKKMVQDSGLLQELRDREAYEKPTTRRKKAKAAGRARHLKELRQQQLQTRKY
jgi:small subunit ribosomal protein S21